MAWLWKQGRPTLLAMVGAGVLGYKAFHRGRRAGGTGAGSGGGVGRAHGAPAADDTHASRTHRQRPGFSAASASRSWPPAS